MPPAQSYRHAGVSSGSNTSDFRSLFSSGGHVGSDEKHRRGRLIVRFVFGMLAICSGVAIIGWICYNELIERLPQYTGCHWWEPFGVGPVLISIGWYWLRTFPGKRQRS